MSEANDPSKRHSACDECRVRKLRCSGVLEGCTRCVKEGLTCHYSIQKQMGRPRKRRKVAGGSEEDCQLNTAWPSASILKENGPSTDNCSVGFAPETIERVSCQEVALDFTSSGASSLPPAALIDSSLSENLALYGNGIEDVDRDVSPPFDSPTTPSLSAIAKSFPSTLDWTDFSNQLDLSTTFTNLSQQKSLPSENSPFTTALLSPTDHSPLFNALPPPSASPHPVVLSCTCLSNLYLALSDLSAQTSHPVGLHTVETLQAAARTAHAVLYCRACPQAFQTSMQNVMLLGTLLTVIAEGWSRVLYAPAKDLARGFSAGAATESLCSVDSDYLDASWTDAKESEWKLFAHYLVRQYVFGDAPPPGVHVPTISFPLSSSSISITTTTTSSSPENPPLIILNNLCNAMERRQNSWHGLVEIPGEFPPFYNGAKALARRGEGNCNKGFRRREMGSGDKEPLCLKIVENARAVLAGVSRRPGS